MVYIIMMGNKNKFTQKKGTYIYTQIRQIQENDTIIHLII